MKDRGGVSRCSGLAPGQFSVLTLKGVKTLNFSADLGKIKPEFSDNLAKIKFSALNFSERRIVVPFGRNMLPKHGREIVVAALSNHVVLVE